MAWKKIVNQFAGVRKNIDWFPTQNYFGNEIQQKAPNYQAPCLFSFQLIRDYNPKKSKIKGIRNIILESA